MSKARDIYEKHFNIDLPKTFEVHHINMDRGDNSIDNLVALPIEHHNAFHKQYYDCIDIKAEADGKIMSIMDLGHGHLEAALILLDDYRSIRKLCGKWLDYKHFLSGYLPNIHNLSYEVSND